MRLSRELKPAHFRPDQRRLVDLDNTELAQLFKLRADRIAKELDGHTWWDNKFTVYWNGFLDRQQQLYEVMMEIQSRYPAGEIHEWTNTLPVMQTPEVRT